MNLKLQSIAEKGSLSSERLVVKVLRAANVGHYSLFRTRKSSAGGASTAVTDVFWFPDKTVKEGDLVVLYSKAGTYSAKRLETGGEAHFFYWGASTALWGGTDAVAVLVNTPEWDSLSP